MAVWLYNWLPPGSSQRGLCRHTHARLGLKAESARGIGNCQSGSAVSPEIGAQRARQSDRSRWDTLRCSAHTRALWASRPDPWLFLSRHAFTSSSVAGGRPGKEVVMRYKRRNWHLWVFRNKNSHLGSEKIRRERIHSEPVDREIWLTNPHILHTILYEKGKKKPTPNSSQRSPNVCNQRVMKIFQVKSLKNKQQPKNQKAFDHSFLNTIGRSTLKHT